MTGDAVFVTQRDWWKSQAFFPAAATVGPEGVFGVMAGIGVHKGTYQSGGAIAADCLKTFRDCVSAGSAIN
jgi:hypothetical protein